MRVLVVNCNTSAEMTVAITDTARSAAAPGTTVIGARPSWGPVSAEGYYESFISAAAVLDLLSTTTETFDAVVMAGFGEHGREGARQLLDVPVVDITEAAAQLACLLGSRFGVVTTVGAAVIPIEESLRTAGLLARCAGVRACEVDVLDLHEDPHATAAALTVEGRRLLAEGADVLVLGCAGMGGLDVQMEKALGVPVVDGVAAAVKLCEALVCLGKRTGKTGPYAPPSSVKHRPGWPVSGLSRLESR
ncbi:aspartate/glutamate racemase family protein [Amycolatopsis sp.]|uniref:aspartate/glutamate racemase family protein n=1 Tax=Amycolatopsis sp. TaxID=37632 RepID=UPI002C2C2346|nr:aspartate/glutamate racemase family protein [Amycolatopsis sp.]HVV13664.1 aspartate/glutamate racemase family protein [Amycolatopsis sp.]